MTHSDPDPSYAATALSNSADDPVDYQDMLMDDWYFEQIDDLRCQPPTPPSLAANRGIVSADDAAPADRPTLPGGRSAILFHGSADCHPWEPAARWHHGTRLCWPCVQHLLFPNDFVDKEAPGPGSQEPGA